MEEDDNNAGGPSRNHMETIVKYVTMTTDISLVFDSILDKMRQFAGDENYKKLYHMEEQTGMKEMIKVLQEKEPENYLQILVDVLVECGCLKNTGWKEKPDPISALLFELREPISLLERLMESVKECDVDKVKQLLSQYPIPQDMEHISRECCALSLERRDLTLVKFLYQEYRSMLDNEETLERFLTEAVLVDFTEGVQFLFSQGLPREENIDYHQLLEEAKSVDMLRLLLSEEQIRLTLNDEPWLSVLYHQILNASTQADCMSRVKILVDAGARVENLINKTKRKAWLKMIKERWLQVFDYLLNQLKDMNYSNRERQNILRAILVKEGDGDVRNNILDFVRNLVERGIDINSVNKHGQSPLVLYCKAGYYDVVKYLIDKGADVNKADNDRQTALTWACKEGNKDVVKYLIQYGGADVNMANINGMTALLVASLGRNKDVVEYLIQHCGADVNKVDNEGMTALMLACNGGHNDVVEYLIQHGGADVNMVDNEGHTVLMWGCIGGNKEVVEYLIQHGGADVNMVDNEGQTALMSACKEGHKDVVEYLIQHGGADVNMVDNKDMVEYLIQHGGADVNKVNNNGMTALMWACNGGHKDVVEYLIQHGGADVNMVDNKGETALMWACIGSRKDVVEYLIHHGGADVNKADNDGRTALLLASLGRNEDVVEYLIQHCGADVNKVDNEGNTALMWACKKGHKDVVEYLIQHGGADVNKADNDGRTALMSACKEGHRYIVEYLIQHGRADANKADNDGRTALMSACKEGHRYIVEYLIQNGGADVNKVDNDGRTALMRACKKGNKDVVEYLIQHSGADANMEDKNGWTALRHCLDKDCFQRRNNIVTNFPMTRTVYAMKWNIQQVNDLFTFLVESGADLSLPSNGVLLFEKILDLGLYDLFLYVISVKPKIVDVTDKGDNILHLLAKVSYGFTVGQFGWLIDCGVDINYENRDTDTPLMVAAVLLNEKYLEVFTHHPAVDLNKQNNNGHTALHCLILGYTELMQEVGQRDDESDTQDYCNQFYPMYMRCVDSLLGAGTNVNVQDNEGRTVLMMAVRENDKQLVKKILDAGAMVDKVDRSGRHALHYVDFPDSVYDQKISFLIVPAGENHLLDLPCTNDNTLIQTVLQFPPWWEPCKVVAFVQWLVSRNCSLRHLRGRTGHSSYNDLSLDDFSCSQRQSLRELLYRSGAPKEEIISTVNFQAEDEVEDAKNSSRNREMFEQFCLNVSLEAKCIRVLRQILGTEIRDKLPGLEIPHLNNFLLLEDVVGDGDDGVLGGFDEQEDESDSCSYIVEKDREYFEYLRNQARDGEGFAVFSPTLRDDRRREYSYYNMGDDDDNDDDNYD